MIGRIKTPAFAGVQSQEASLPVRFKRATSRPHEVEVIMKRKCVFLAIALLAILAVSAYAQSGQSDAWLELLRQTNPDMANQVENFQQSQRPSAQAEAALSTALANEGTVTVIANSSGAILKTLTVNPAEAALRTPGGSFHVYITNPARLAIEFNNVVHQDLYQVQLPRTINEAAGSAVVGAQFMGTKYTGGCGVTILSNRGNIFRIQVRGTGTFYDENNNQMPASITGIFEVTYLGATTGQGMTTTPQTQEQKEQQAMELIQDLLNQM